MQYFISLWTRRICELIFHRISWNTLPNFILLRLWPLWGQAFNNRLTCFVSFLLTRDLGYVLIFLLWETLLFFSINWWPHGVKYWPFCSFELCRSNCLVKSIRMGLTACQNHNVIAIKLGFLWIIDALWLIMIKKIIFAQCLSAVLAQV